MASRAAFSVVGAALLLIGSACATASIPDDDLAFPDRVEQNKGSDAAVVVPTTCSPGQTKCSGACVDLQSSSEHCGSCGAACVGTASCTAGKCGVTTASCAAGQVACAGKCVDLLTDPANCGNCGHVCGGDAGGVCTSGGCPGQLRVRVYVDGDADLVFAGDKVKWHVVRAAAPGLWDGHNEATFLNTVPWFPTWPNGGENRDCNCDSQLSPPVPALAKLAQTVAITIVESRGSVTITEQPSAANQWTLKARFSDPPNGAAWFEVVLDYVSN